ncbi:hypothetical protein ACLMJK_007225 [Lecanora helva]
MGLRMFVEPDVAPSKPAVKSDPTASARSSIRRQRTVRYSPSVREHMAALDSLASRSRDNRMRMLSNRRSLMEDIRRMDPEATSSTSNRDDTHDVEAEADAAHSEAIRRNRQDSGRALLRDALSYERPGQRMRIPSEDTIPRARRLRHRNRPSSRNESELLRTLSRSEGTRSPPPRYMPTPPHTSGDSSSRSSPHVPTPPLGQASLTSGFPPAHQLDRAAGITAEEIRANLEREETLARLAVRMEEMSDAGERDYVAGHRAEINRMRSRNPADLTTEYREAEAAYLESVETRLDLMRRMREHDLAELPALQRMRPHSRGHSRSDLDGLGDRERSFSPEDDQWETMLTTIQPDERVPSTHSSFTSTTASSSSLSSNPVSSYGTLVTAPSTVTDVEVCPADFDDSDDSDSLSTLDAQLTQAEDQGRRINWLSERVHRYIALDHSASRTMMEREQDLQELEAGLSRLERQIDDEQPGVTLNSLERRIAEAQGAAAAAGRQRRDGDRAGRERL